MFKPLRDKILELAITGKLVPQMDSEPAVEQIGPAPAKEEEPFALPEKWKWVRLEYLSLASFSGGTPSKDKSDYWNGSIPWASIKDLSVDSEELSATKDHITAKGLANSSTKLVEANNVIVGMRMGLNKVVINTIPLAINQDLRAFYLDCSLIAPKFFVKFYRTLKFEGAGTTVKGIRKDELMGMFVPLPPLEEQRRIVAKLDDIMGNLERMDQAYTELSGPMLKHFKNLVLQQAVSGQLVPQLDSEPDVEQIGPALADEEVPFALPKKWKWVRLDQVTTKITDGTHNPPPNAGSGIPVLSAKDIDEAGVLDLNHVTRWATDYDFCKESKKIRIELNDVLLTIVGSIGRAAVVRAECKFMLQRSVAIIRPTADLSSDYLKSVFISPSVQQWFSLQAAGTAQKGIYLSKLKSVYIPLPPLEEQRRIVARIEELFGDVDKLLDWQQFA